MDIKELLDNLERSGIIDGTGRFCGPVSGIPTSALYNAAWISGARVYAEAAAENQHGAPTGAVPA